MSAILDSALDKDRLDACAANARAMDLGGISTLDSAQSRRMLDAQFQSDSTAVAEAADLRTRKVRAEIQALSHLSAPEAAAILSSLISAFERSGELRTSDRGVSAGEKLLDAVHFLEEGV